MAASPTPGIDPIKVGVIAEQTGPLSFVGLANANVARMVIGDINAKGGLLGRRLELHLEDGATDDAVAAAAAAKLVERDAVDVVFGGIYSSTRQAIKGPVVVKGKTLYIYPEQYEGAGVRSAHLLHRPGPAQQVDPFIPWLMRETGATDVLPPVRRLHLAARVEQARAGHRHGQRRVDRRRGVLPARPHRTTRRRSSGSTRVAPTRCSTRSCRPGSRRSSRSCYDSGFSSRGGRLVCTYFDENFLNMVPATHVEGLYGCLDYYQAVGDPFSQKLLAQYDALYPGDAKFTGGSACSGLYRGLRLWASAVTEAGSLVQEDVIAALDHASIAEGPGGPAAMVPGAAPRAHEHVHRARRATAASRSSRASERSIRRNARCKRRPSPAETYDAARTRPEQIYERRASAMLLATTQVGGLRRVHPRGPPDHEGGRTQDEAAGRAARRSLRRLTCRQRHGEPATAGSPS